jgi:3-hydroxyacyl-CoA dehydrogenase
MTRPQPIRSVAILGAGTMGAQIAAHCANAGMQVRLLDLTADVAREGLKRAAALKPDPFFTKDTARQIAFGGFDTDLGTLSGVDWICEAIVERIDTKRALFERIEAVRTPGTIVTTNTSGIPIAAIAEGRGDDFRRHFCGTHFFNPPRYLRLLEIIPTPDTAEEVVERLRWTADHRLGKGVVIAKDSPGFIANRLGLFGVAQAVRLLAAGEYSVEEIDAITGPALGRPKSATFRTMDIAGLDVLAHVTGDLVSRLRDPLSREAYTLPPLVSTMVERKMIGEKSGHGFYKREGSAILSLDPATLTYRPRESVRIPSLEAPAADVRERVRALFHAKDKAGAFLRATLPPLLVYTANIAPSIAESIDDIDRAMHWGFGWELGPFELWDAIGIDAVLASAPAQVPPVVEELKAAGRSSFRDGAIPPSAPGLQLLRSAKDRSAVVRRNPGASLIDLGDDVLAVELHSKMNAIGEDTIQMLHAGVSEAARNFAGLVVCTDGADFSAGANLMLVLLEAQDGNWDEIDFMVRTFQQATSA